MYDDGYLPQSPKEDVVTMRINDIVTFRVVVVNGHCSDGAECAAGWSLGCCDDSGECSTWTVSTSTEMTATVVTGCEGSGNSLRTCGDDCGGRRKLL